MPFDKKYLSERNEYKISSRQMLFKAHVSFCVKDGGKFLI